MNATAHEFLPEEVMAYLDGELSPERIAIMSAHLKTCAECSALATDLRAVSQKMRAWQVEPFPPNLVDRVTAITGEECAKRGPLPRSALKQRRSPAFTWVVGIASGFAALLLLLAISIPNLLRSKMAANEASAFSRQRIAQTEKAIQEAPKAVEGGLQLSPMVVRTAELKIVVAKLSAAREHMERILRVHGGYVGDLMISEPEGSAPGLSATLRIPANQLDAALAELKNLGRAEQESQGGEEVTQQYVDLRARLDNARATEQRLIDVLRMRTGKVGDILEVEKEIARVREEIERMDAERKTLEKRVQFATLKLSLAEEYKQQLNLAAPSAGTRLWNALAEGCRDAVDTGLAIVLFLLNYGPTLILLGALLFWPARFAWRHLRATQLHVTTGT